MKRVDQLYSEIVKLSPAETIYLALALQENKVFENSGLIFCTQVEEKIRISLPIKDQIISDPVFEYELIHTKIT